MKLGPVMADVSGLELTAEDRGRLAHPLVGSVILFGRNYASPAQLVRLAQQIRAVRKPELLVCVDHEGGRVQRFREGFTAIPPMRELGRRWDQDRKAGLAAARACGFTYGAELQAHGVDFSFAPVLDVDFGESGVIGDRAFHRDPNAIAALAGALVEGLRESGMAAIGKHFPGHGYVRADSHHEVPIDERTLEAIRAEDLVPFRKLAGALAGIMPAHVIYPEVDPHPAGFSRKWLHEILRMALGFRGAIFSDDLSMEGARVAGDVVARGHAALDAGCDVVLLCNDSKSLDKLLDGLARRRTDPALGPRLEALRGRAISDRALAANAAYLEARALIA